MINDRLFWEALAECAAGSVLIFAGIAGLLILWARRGTRR